MTEEGDEMKEESLDIHHVIHVREESPDIPHAKRDLQREVRKLQYLFYTFSVNFDSNFVPFFYTLHDSFLGIFTK
jgi:hypothetical protein